jgi:hypothetical protein
MELKKGSGTAAALLQQSMEENGPQAVTIGASSEMVALLKDIASSCSDMAETNRGILKPLQK